MKFLLDLSQSEHAELKARAALKKITMNAYILIAVHDLFEKEGEDHDRRMEMGKVV